MMGMFFGCLSGVTFGGTFRHMNATKVRILVSVVLWILFSAILNVIVERGEGGEAFRRE